MKAVLCITTAIFAATLASSAHAEESPQKECQKVLTLANGNYIAVSSHISSAAVYNGFVPYKGNNYFLKVKSTDGQNTEVNYGKNKNLRNKDFQLVQQIVLCNHK